MILSFNDLLLKAGFDLSEVRLLRHQTRTPQGRTPYLLWRDDRAAFDDYQSVQTAANRTKLGAPYWATFVVPPSGGTLFAGLYRAERLGPSPKDRVDPLFKRTDAELTADELDAYRLTLSLPLNDYAGKVWIDWGLAARSWIQRSDKQDKAIEAITEFCEDAFPGYTHFIANISDIPTLPRSWAEALRSAQGIYLLTSDRTGEWYVGSATSSEGGFLARWLAYAADGHGGNIGLKSSEPSDYQVSILEVVGSATTLKDTLAIEALWKRKLQSREMGSLQRN
nr:GIY-YIG nuclease family protein [Sphingomonas sp. Y57]